MRVSRVVLAEFAQLTPDRTASITLAAGGTNAQVDVKGYSYQTGPGGATGLAPDVRVVVQQRQAGVTDEELGWIPVDPAGTLLPSSIDPAGVRTWSGPVTLPAPQGSEPFRFVITEEERYPAVGGLGPGSRVVYVDLLEV